MPRSPDPVTLMAMAGAAAADERALIAYHLP